MHLYISFNVHQCINTINQSIELPHFQKESLLFYKESLLLVKESLLLLKESLLSWKELPYFPKIILFKIHLYISFIMHQYNQSINTITKMENPNSHTEPQKCTTASINWTRQDTDHTLEKLFSSVECSALLLCCFPPDLVKYDLEIKA